MSDSSIRGRSYEMKIAKLIRHKLKVPAVRDSRSGANDWRRSDIYTRLPYHFEVKDHEKIKVKEWYRQSRDSAASLSTPLVIFKADELDLCIIDFSDLLNMIREIMDYEG